MRVVAAEPSNTMLEQHPGDFRVQAVAEALPFRGSAFDASMAIMTIHHWTNIRAGLKEMQRVARRQVIFTWDKNHDTELWIVAEYLPEIRDLERARFPLLSEVVDAVDADTVLEFPIPHDFTDGYQPAFWRRPEAYLDPHVRAASSTFASLPNHVIEPAMRRLEADLASGAWSRRHEDLTRRESVDYGYRLVVGPSNRENTERSKET
jgi:SAM-dependent methyltransferase